MLDNTIWNTAEKLLPVRPPNKSSAHLKYVLIVDDDVDFRLGLSELLVANGYRVSTAKNGNDALSFLNNHSELPDLILVDLIMPILGGLEFREIQLNHQLYSTIPVIFISGNEQVRDERSFQKPIMIHQLLNEMDEILNYTFH